MSKTIEQITKELDAKIPREVVSERDGGGGRKLSYLEGWYVIDRLNQIFGPLGWSKEIIEVKEVVNKTPRGEFPAYIVKVALTIHSPTGETGYNNRVVKEAYGYGADKSSQNAHELAIKEAVTDALKVAAKDLGMSLGLALYDKTQEFVDDGHVETRPQSQGPKSVERAAEAPKPKPESKEVKPAATPAPDADKLRAVIRSHVSAAIKKGVTSMDDVKAHLVSNYGADNLNDITDPTALSKVLDHVKTLTN